MPQPAQPATKSPQRPRSKTRLCRSGGGLQNITFYAMLCFIGWIEQGNAVSGLFLLVLRRRSAVSARRTVGATSPARVLRAAIPLERWFGIKSGFAVSPTPAAPCEFRRPSHCGYFKPVFPGSRFVCYFPPPRPQRGSVGSEQTAVFLRFVCSVAPRGRCGRRANKIFLERVLTNYTLRVIIIIVGDEQTS